MKTRKRSYPLDSLLVEQGTKTISARRDGNLLRLSCYDGDTQVAFHEFTFDQFFSLIKRLEHGIQNILEP